MLKGNVTDKWYKDTFDENYIFLFEPLRTEEFTQHEINCMIKQLDLKPGTRILDLGCGYGRHTIALTKCGYDVVGLDYSETLLAKAKAESEGMGIEWVQADMREIPFENEFDVVINNAFGYLESDDEEQKMIDQVYKCLKPGGKFLQWEIPNKECWSRKYVGLESANMGGYLVERRSEYDFLSGKEYQQYSLSSNNTKVLERNFCVRVFDITEILKLYKAANLEFVKATDLQNKEVDFDTPELCLISKKPL